MLILPIILIVKTEKHLKAVILQMRRNEEQLHTSEFAKMAGYIKTLKLHGIIQTFALLKTSQINMRLELDLLTQIMNVKK